VSDGFGVSVALNDAGTVLAVGASAWEGAADNQGGVYIYDWSGSAWVQRGSVLTASDAAVSDGFGASVALNDAGTVLAVGANVWEGAAADQGGVYIYDWSGSAWVQRGSVLTASDFAESDRFGRSVALNAAGTVLAVGAHFWEGTADNQGGVYIYDDGVPLAPPVTYTVAGVVRDRFNALCARDVRVYRRSNGELVAQQVSNATTGAFNITVPDVGPFYVTCLGEPVDVNGGSNAKVFDFIVPMTVS
jgi:hypothetical protein